MQIIWITCESHFLNLPFSYAFALDFYCFLKSFYVAAMMLLLNLLQSLVNQWIWWLLCSSWWRNLWPTMDLSVVFVRLLRQLRNMQHNFAFWQRIATRLTMSSWSRHCVLSTTYTWWLCQVLNLSASGLGLVDFFLILILLSWSISIFTSTLIAGKELRYNINKTIWFAKCHILLLFMYNSLWSLL